MLKTHELLEKRTKLTEEGKAILAAPGGADGYLSPEQETRHKAITDELERLDATIKAQAMQDELDRRAVGAPLTTSGDNRLDQELRSFSLVKAIAGAAGLAVDWGRERELQGELAKRNGKPAQGILVPLEVFEKRVLTTAAPVGGPGSNIISTDLMGSQFIDMLRAKLVVRRLGARVLNGLVGNVDIPKLTATTTAGWVAENAAITPADPEVDKVQLTPKHAGAITEYSRNMLMQSSPDVEQLLRADMAQVLAQAVDGVAIQGGGSNEPTGILETSGIGDVAMGTDGGPITWAKVIDLIAEVEIDNAEGSAFLTNPKVVKSARKTAKVTSTDSVMVMDAPGILAGYPLASTTLVPSNLTKGNSSGVCSALIFGNFSDLLLGYWSVLDVLVNPYESTAYTKGNVMIRSMLTMDVAVRHPESFAAIQDLTTA